jgi:uncharacterized membrane protein YgaE (UPF0421/DUF939 family)
MLMFAEINMQVLQPVITIFTGILIAVVSAWLTFYLSIKEFRKEWLWKRKADVYSAIIEALHNSKAFNVAHLNSMERGTRLSEQRDKELGLRAIQGHDAIKKSIDIGSFLLSNKALERLKKYLQEAEAISMEQDLYSYFDEDLAAIERCLKDIIPIAKEDLEK